MNNLLYREVAAGYLVLAEAQCPWAAADYRRLVRDCGQPGEEAHYWDTEDSETSNLGHTVS
jgi:hypothetical protein